MIFGINFVLLFSKYFYKQQCLFFLLKYFYFKSTFMFYFKKCALWKTDNTLPFWFLEVVASYVSMTNRCDYSLTHHFANARRLMNDPVRSQLVWDALSASEPERAFSGKELELLRYARKLTADVAHMEKSDFEALKAEGCDDGEILEVNQVCAYFNYSNRLLNGLGVTTQGDVVGYYKEPAAT